MNRFCCVFFCLFFLLTSCTQEQYTFPSSIQPQEKGWKKACIVTLSYRASGSAYEKSEKKITVKVTDPFDSSVVVKEYNFDAAFISAKVNWLDENSFHIELWEEGSNDAKSSYSRELVQKGSKLLMSESFILGKNNQWSKAN